MRKFYTNKAFVLCFSFDKMEGFKDKKGTLAGAFSTNCLNDSLLYFLNDGLESIRMIQSQVGQYFSVKLNTCILQLVNKYRVG